MWCGAASAVFSTRPPGRTSSIASTTAPVFTRTRCGWDRSIAANCRLRCATIVTKTWSATSKGRSGASAPLPESTGTKACGIFAPPRSRLTAEAPARHRCAADCTPKASASGAATASSWHRCSPFSRPGSNVSAIRRSRQKTMATGHATPITAELLRRALAHLDRNEVWDAEARLSQLLVVEPENPQALQLMGVLRRMQNRLDEAEDFYRRSLALAPAQPHVHHNLGNVLKAQGRFAESAAAQREAVRLKPNYAEAHLNLAIALSEMGDHEGAAKSCRDALRIQPNYLFAKQTLAAELCALDRPKEAERLLRQTLDLGIRDQRQVAALEHNLGIALSQQKKYAEALPYFDTAQSKVPEMPAVR